MLLSDIVTTDNFAAPTLYNGSVRDKRKEKINEQILLYIFFTKTTFLISFWIFLGQAAAFFLCSGVIFAVSL